MEMAKINLEQLLVDLVRILDCRVRNPHEPCVDISAIQAALSNQGYKINSKGELVGIDEIEPVYYIVYDKDNNVFVETNEKPSLEGDDCFLKLDVKNRYVRQSDYLAFKTKQLETFLEQFSIK